MFGRKTGKAHSAAVKAARLQEIVENELKQTLLQMGESEFLILEHKRQLGFLQERVVTLRMELEHANEKAMQDKAEAERMVK